MFFLPLIFSEQNGWSLIIYDLQYSLLEKRIATATNIREHKKLLSKFGFKL